MDKVRRYTDQSGEEVADSVADSVKVATVLNVLRNERLLEHLQLNSGQVRAVRRDEGDDPRFFARSVEP